MRLKRYFGLIILLALLVVIPLFFFPVPTLVVGQQNKADVLIIPLFKDKTFSYFYIHSVQKTPVQEYFSAAPDNTLILTSTEFKSLGVGLPFLADEGTFKNQQGTFLITDINRKFPQINIGIIPLAQQALIYKNQFIYFNDYFSPGAMISIRLKTYSPAHLIGEKIFYQKEVYLDCK